MSGIYRSWDSRCLTDYRTNCAIEAEMKQRLFGKGGCNNVSQAEYRRTLQSNGPKVSKILRQMVEPHCIPYHSLSQGKVCKDDYKKNKKVGLSIRGHVLASDNLPAAPFKP